MKKFNRFLVALLALLLVLTGCNNGGNEGGGETAGEDTPLVVGYSPFNEKFSPFFAETAYDQDVQGLTQIGLIGNDRAGAIIFNGIEGETINYNGTDYTYYGPANIEIVENADGTVDYNITLREDITFSDGTKMTIDDVIFNFYVLSDPTYDGSSTFSALKIKGMEEYRSGMDILQNLLYNAGRENTDFSFWTEEQQTAFWSEYDAATLALAEEIVKYCVDNGYNEEGDIQGAAANWGFEAAENTMESFAAALEAGYGADVAGMITTEAAGSSVEDLFPTLGNYSAAVEYGESAPNISGIVKTGDYSCTVTTTEVDAKAIYSLGVTIAPMHYYGEADKYDYANNKFGFDKGDLSHVRSVTTKPMGAGPYKFIKYENGVVNFEANETYYKGAPKIKYINFQESSDKDKVNGVIQGTIDVTDPSFSTETVKTIEDANGGELTGNVVTTSLVKNLGYGYLGIDANRVNVGGAANKASDASKNLRRALATVFSAYRDVTVSSYYGERASVINYPISDTSWAAPKPADPGYEVAFSKDVNGNPIYTSDMDDAAREEAALNAALGFFEAAGYTVTDGKLTAAPEGAALEYEAWIPADGAGDHPSFMMLTEAKNALEKIGFNLIVRDLANSSDLWTGLEANGVDIWCAAWGATIDPDMTQIYFSDAANSTDGGVTGGPNRGGSNYMYDIVDPELDTLIKDALKTTDQEYRKQMYKACLDIVIDWASEIPVYQRENCIIFSTERVNMDTVTPDITTFYGWMSEIENTEMK